MILSWVYLALDLAYHSIHYMVCGCIYHLSALIVSIWKFFEIRAMQIRLLKGMYNGSAA